MDRRQIKTRQAIFDAFSKLLSQKSYMNITVQEIIDEANVGRSTFYAHFETKDELLRSMCTEIFNHVFDDSLKAEDKHDFSGSQRNLKSQLIHLLCHLQENSKNISGVLFCESGDLFMRYFKEYLSEMFSFYIPEGGKVPRDFILNFYVGSFAETVVWWFQQKMKYTPEQEGEYFLAFEMVTRRNENSEN
ncbi:MAG: TetR/AcrR family transcriptional regulator [Clostridia bacterium]|nr:TetR/AcrR family transcriptional regulator [Clostridia bacterium]